MRIILSIIIASLANPVLAASGPFISLSNTNFVVLLAFLLFVGLLIYLKVPGKLNGMLDERAKGIQSELDEARSLREEAQSILAEYERMQRCPGTCPLHTQARTHRVARHDGRSLARTTGNSELRRRRV